VVPPGKSLKEAMAEQKLDPKMVQFWFPGMDAIMVHHDASNVHQQIQRLVSRGLITSGEAEHAWTAIQYHGFVSSWIMKNSFGGWGIKSHVFDAAFDKKLAPYLDAYQRVSERLGREGFGDFDALMKDPAFAKDVAAMREAFRKMPPYAQALMLGDHQGQIDIAKYMTILSAGATKDTSIHDLFFDKHMSNSMLGVLRTHSLEQRIHSENNGKLAEPAFTEAEAWMRNSDPDQPGLAQAVLKNADLSAKFEAWKKGQTGDVTVQDWLKTLKVKSGTAASDEFKKIQAEVESAFYQFHALGEKKPLDWRNSAANRAAPSPVIPDAASAPKFEPYWDFRVRMVDEMTVGRVIEYYQHSIGVRDDLAAMAKRTDDWGAEATKFQEALVKFEKASQEYFAAERKFRSQSEADADPHLTQQFQGLAKMADDLEAMPYHKLEIAHRDMMRDPRRDNPKDNSLGGQLWPLENALAKLRFADLGKNFEQGKTQPSFDFEVRFASLQDVSKDPPKMFLADGIPWKTSSTGRFVHVEVTVDNWKRAEDIVQGLRQASVKTTVDGKEIVETTLELKGDLVKSADGQSAIMKVTVKGPPKHTLELRFNLKGEAVPASPAVANDNVASEKLGNRSVTAEPAFEGRSGHDSNDFPIRPAHDYYEKVLSSGVDLPMNGGILVPHIAGDPAPTEGMVWKVKAAYKDYLILEEGVRYQGESQRPIRSTQEIAIKVEGATRFEAGQEVRWVPPVADSNHEAKPQPLEIRPPDGTDKFTVGRDPNSSAYVLEGAKISRTHVTFAQDPNGDWHLIDGSIDSKDQRNLSKNGVKIWDGEKEIPVGREGWFRLREGQLIKVGEHWMVWHSQPTSKAQTQAPAPKTAVIQPETFTMDSTTGLGADMATFNIDRKYLADTVELPGVQMTPALRKELKRAESVFERGGEVSVLKGKPILIDLVSGAHTVQSHRASPEVAQFYEIWKGERSFPKADPVAAKQAWGELQARAKSLGIAIEYGDSYMVKDKQEVSHEAIVYLNELMKMLPDSMLANMHLKKIALNVARKGPGLLSSYDEQTGTAFIYSGAFSGTRQNMAGLFFHELGHSTAERYDTGPTGDGNIPLAARKKMHAAHRTLMQGNAFLGIDWANGSKARADYQETFVEFLAEMNLMYVTAGPKLRQHIESFPEGSPERAAWDFVYAEMRDRVFGGREYGYTRPAVPVAEQRVATTTEVSPDWDAFTNRLQSAEIGLNSLPQGHKQLDVYVGDPNLLPADAGPAIVASAFSSGQAPQYWGTLWQGGDGWSYHPSGDQKVFRADYFPKEAEQDGGYRLAEGDILTLGYHYYVFSQGKLKLMPDVNSNEGTISPSFTLHVPEVAAAAYSQVDGHVEQYQVPPPRVDVQILAGPVDFNQQIPIQADGPTAYNGEVARATTQGRGYKAVNEDLVLTVRGPNGELVMLDVDGMGGHGNGDVAATLVAEAFSAEYARSGDTDKAWQLANQAVLRFNGVAVPRLQRAEVIEATKPDQAQALRDAAMKLGLKAARDLIADPTLLDKGPLSDGSGAVAVMVEQRPPTADGQPAVARFQWVGDARAMQIRADDTGRLRWVYRTVDEGYSSDLRPGVDYPQGGAGRTLVGQLLPNANVVFNAIGTNTKLQVRGTQHGETPDPQDPTGTRLVGDENANGLELKQNDWVILASDGFWENFGRTEYMLNVLDRATNADEATRLLTDEVHWRMDILSQVKARALPQASSGRYIFEKTGGFYYIDVQGRWRKSEKMEIDRFGAVYEPGGREPVDHFKNDNFSVTVYRHNPNSAPTSKDAAPVVDGRSGPDRSDPSAPGVYGQKAVEVSTATGKADGSAKDLQTLGQTYADKRAELLKSIQAQGSIEGTARTYEASEFSELLHQVLERGQPIETLPSAKGIRGQVEDHMYSLVVEVERRFPGDFKNVKVDPETGESFITKGNDGKFKQNIPAMYRYAKRLLNQKQGLPAHGQASPKQQELVLGFVQRALSKKDASTYEKAAEALRQEFRTLSPDFRKAYNAKPFNPAMRAALLDALFDGKSYVTFTDRAQVTNLIRFLGKSGHHLEFGLSADISKQPTEYLLSLGDMHLATNPKPGLVAMFHTHTTLYLNRKSNVMGHRDTLDLDTAKPAFRSVDILFSATDIDVMIHDAQKLSKEGAKIPGLFENGIYRNWVQHSFGLSEAELKVGSNGKVSEVKIRYGFYPEGNPGKDHLKMIEQLQAHAKKTHPNAKITFEEMTTAEIESRIP